MTIEISVSELEKDVWPLPVKAPEEVQYKTATILKSSTRLTVNLTALGKNSLLFISDRY